MILKVIRIGAVQGVLEKREFPLQLSMQEKGRIEGD